MPGFFIHSVSMTHATGTSRGAASVLKGETCLLCTVDELGDVDAESSYTLVWDVTYRYGGDEGSHETKRQRAERKE